jgi:hypothetical protein
MVGGKKRLKCLIRLHPRFPLCYAEAAMDTPKGHRPLRPRVRACSFMNALKHGRYARRLTRTLEQAGEREQQMAERLARQVWCYGWKALEQVKANRGCY